MSAYLHLYTAACKYIHLIYCLHILEYRYVSKLQQVGYTQKRASEDAPESLY